MFYFVRHGQADYSERNTKIYQGFGVNLSKLSEIGVHQIRETAKDKRLQGANLILSSPYTRALQTASILSKELGIDIVIETDLYEWLANKNFLYEDDETAEISYMEYERNQGKYPANEEKLWESAQSIRERVLKVLRNYSNFERVIVVCHGMIIQATTQGKHPNYGEVVEFNLE